MKKYYAYVLGALLVSMLMISCSNDENGSLEAGKEDVTGMTSFSQTLGEDTTSSSVTSDSTPKASAASRTSAHYTGNDGIAFYWTVGDKLWINNGGTLEKSQQDDISGEVATAKFYFNGVYHASTYPVRYTGNEQGDRVIINANQTQSTVNNASHIGQDGDCGVGTATRNTDGSYKFTLSHKASYIIFAPCYAAGTKLAESVKITQVKVTANENIAGTYDFDDSGLKTNTVSDGSKAINLKLTGNFTVPSASDPTKNGAIMVLAPGTYADFTVAYTLEDETTGVSTVITKNYGARTFEVGKTKRIFTNLAINSYEGKYYMWDAKQPFWAGYESVQPNKDGESNGNYPTSGDRYYNTRNQGQSVAANPPTSRMPNINQMMWYVWRGNPHWDGDAVWTARGHLYKGGMWFLKKSNISGFDYYVSYYNNTDYRQIAGSWPEGNASWETDPSQGRPVNTDNYFFLPAMGYYSVEGKLYLSSSKYAGVYWTSTAPIGSSWPNSAACLHFSSEKVGIEVDGRNWGYIVEPTWFQ